MRIVPLADVLDGAPSAPSSSGLLTCKTVSDLWKRALVTEILLRHGVPVALDFSAESCGAKNVAIACCAAGVPLVHFSTDYVFDGTKPGNLEHDAVAPLSVYGRSKLAGEDIIRATHPMHLILRTAWLYGVFGKNVLKTMMRLAGERDEIRVVTDQRGNPTSTGQIAEAIVSIMPRLLDRNCPWGTYHLAASGTASWFSFAENIVAEQSKHTGKQPAVVPIATGDYPAVAKRPPNSKLDCSLFQETFGVGLGPWGAECERVVDALSGTELGTKAFLS